MHGRIILANPERKLYAAHVAVSRKIAVFELTVGAPLRIGDIIRATFTFTGAQQGWLAGEDAEIEIFILKTEISPLAAHVCLESLGECLSENDEPP